MKKNRRRERTSPEPARPRGSPEKSRGFAAGVIRIVDRHAMLVALAFMVLHLALQLLTFLPQPHSGGDNAAYITLGRSLLERHAYLSLYDPATPPHTQYPPGFALILAIALAAGLQPWVQLKVLIALFSAVAVGLSFLWIRRRRSPVLALGVATLLAFSPGVIELGHWILSDVPFWFFTMLALWAFERLPSGMRGRFAIAVLATVLAYFTRSAGLPLVIAALGWLALRRRWKQLAVLAAVIVPLAFLWWLRAGAQGGVDYVGQFWLVDPYTPALGRIGVADLFARAWENLSKYVSLHVPILLMGYAGPVPMARVIGSAAVVALALFGWARRLRRPGVAELFLPLYIGLLLVWPAVWSGERFLLPVLPLIVYYAFDATAHLAGRAVKGGGYAVAGGALALLVLIGLPTLRDQMRISSQCVAEYRSGNRYPCMAAPWTDFFGVAEWAGGALPEGSVVLSRKPRLFYVLSGLRGRTFPLTSERGALFAEAKRLGARYVVLDGLDRLSTSYVMPVIMGTPQAFCIAFSTTPERAAVLGILPGDWESATPNPQSPAASVGFQYCPADYWRAGMGPR